MSAPASHQSPVVLQRQQSTRHQPHQRQPSSASSRNGPPPSRGNGDGSLNQLPARDAETSRLPSSGSHRPSHSRNPSGAVDGSSSNGGPSHHGQPPVTVDDPRMHQMQRPRKTSIQGSSGTWNLGKTIGAGSMGKVKLARKADGTEQVCIRYANPYFRHQAYLWARLQSRLSPDR